MKIQGKIYLVGGAVRDIIMKNEPKDRDYVIVGGSEQNLLSLGFKKVGADFPVFLHPETNEEYALARVERKSGVGYGGFTVETEGVTLEQDLSRRDFTINAMAIPLHSPGSIVDPFGGQRDIGAGLIKHVTDAFKDDPLRALRAFRFAARYDFDISRDTVTAIKAIPKEDLDALAKERIYLEVTKAIGDGQFSDFIRNTRFCGMDWLIAKVLVDFSSSAILKMKNQGKDIDVDAYITCIIFGAMVDGDTVANFEATSFHRQVAKIWYTYHTSAKTPLDQFNLINSIGEWGSPKFFLLGRSWHIYYKDPSKLALKALWFVYKSVTSKTVLANNPLLEGKALGDAIKATRIEALRSFIED
jgi:tRNA nucleotidyltransferase/poly(A) polymerase